MNRPAFRTRSVSIFLRRDMHPSSYRVPEWLPLPGPRRRPPFAILAAAMALVLLGVGFFAWWKSSSRPAGIDSIAVLPFADLSPDKNQAYFCDGFTEELISELSGIDGLRVVARTSTFAFKDKAEDIREIGRKLNAAAVVEGSVRRSGNTLRITAQLIRSSNGYHIWSRSFDRNTKDVLAVQEEISRLIADTVRLPFQAAQSTAPKLEAYDLYLLGRYHWSKEDPRSTKRPSAISKSRSQRIRNSRWRIAVSRKLIRTSSTSTMPPLPKSCLGRGLRPTRRWQSTIHWPNRIPPGAWWRMSLNGIRRKR